MKEVTNQSPYNQYHGRCFLCTLEEAEGYVEANCRKARHIEETKNLKTQKLKRKVWWESKKNLSAAGTKKIAHYDAEKGLLVVYGRIGLIKLHPSVLNGEMARCIAYCIGATEETVGEIAESVTLGEISDCITLIRARMEGRQADSLAMALERLPQIRQVVQRETGTPGHFETVREDAYIRLEDALGAVRMYYKTGRIPDPEED